MRAALDEVGLDEPYDTQLWEYLVMAAHGLVNRPSEPVRPDLGLSPA
jgi:hemoglobin